MALVYRNILFSVYLTVLALLMLFSLDAHQQGFMWLRYTHLHKMMLEFE